MYAENQTSHSLKSLQTDNAKEFLSLCHTPHGIYYRLIFLYMHVQNDSIGRKHWHGFDMSLSLLVDASCLLSFRVNPSPLLFILLITFQHLFSIITILMKHCFRKNQIIIF